MTHSSRRSYKEKYERLRNAKQIREVDEGVQNLADTADFLALADHERRRQHEIVVEIAPIISELAVLLDSQAGKFGLTFKDIKSPIDGSLANMDGTLILRRTRDVVRHSLNRLAIAAIKDEETHDQVSALKTGVLLLKKPVASLQKGYLESYTIGLNPTDNEMREAHDTRGKSPRQLDYEYRTDEDESDSSEQEEDSMPTRNTSAIAQRPKRIEAKGPDYSIDYN